MSPPFEELYNELEMPQRKSFPPYMKRLNVCLGKATYEAVARALGHDYVPAEDMLH